MTKKRMRVVPPDWTVTSSAMGGHLAEVRPQPPVRRFPHKGCKRIVDVSISSWVGISLGARHTYAKVEEAHNAVWDGRDDGGLHSPRWTEPWDDREGRGREFQKDCLTREEAHAYIASIVKRHFSSKTRYEIRSDWNAGDDLARMYGREGD
jgi:hypothetical protein